jgi:hypothetical protein
MGRESAAETALDAREKRTSPREHPEPKDAADSSCDLSGPRPANATTPDQGWFERFSARRKKFGRTLRIPETPFTLQRISASGNPPWGNHPKEPIRVWQEPQVTIIDSFERPKSAKSEHLGTEFDQSQTAAQIARNHGPHPRKKAPGQNAAKGFGLIRFHERSVRSITCPSRSSRGRGLPPP